MKISNKTAALGLFSFMNPDDVTVEAGGIAFKSGFY
jgi:hypothetical protein